MNRCRHDITESILISLQSGSKRITELCLAANLPVDRGKDMVKRMERFGLLYETVGDEGTEHWIAERGYEWLGLYRLLKKRLPDIH